MLYAEGAPTPATMHAIAAAAGCGRTTVYRYFENREALQRAFAERELQRIGELVAARTTALTDPAERLGEAILVTIALVRETPVADVRLKSDAADRIAKIAYSSPVAETLALRYLPGGHDSSARADWLIRGIISILLHPSADSDSERALVTKFLVPALMDVAASTIVAPSPPVD
ncbi:TetR family transcriptional regulator [Mycobacteroides abscessus]|nr:TetR family transcriptional regulator [Mycobacteroides abscessus]SKT94216.1 TetR family transcriptional regulator [Mycobacteroides abscessus subsp. massiliense]SKU20270.1 TetR family transcriptional regulator [Mycobacteroides abscessus subsp. massiliense]